MARLISPTDLEFFLALANACSVSRTARELGITPAAVSKHLALMESRLGVPLFNRTTRSMSLTPEGDVYLGHARKILGSIGEMEDQLLGATASPQGLLRVNATLGFGRSHIAPLISDFVRKYPQVDIQLQLSVNPPPSGDDAYDICFRFGNPPDSRSIARLIAANRRVVVASPAYLKRHGEPKTPADLARHNCIGIRQGDEAYGLWRFATTKGKGKNSSNSKTESTESVKIRGNLTTNDGGIAVNWALDGHGILLRAEWDVQKYLQSGRLVQLLAQYSSPDADIYAVYAQQHRTSLRVKTFLDFVVAASGG
ncbi:LysR family transcriptional regulator [Acidovorax sp. FJL06]|uniref:LysR family transcriptional regulator n=1 Tax=Acidovorax sp. FJL06 TaxID=2153365 RepID=UPI000F58ABA0|nr:LysR family transcriptional regulator [Acidovorax sp. FJL06]RQO80890.1 LysR family transcriptional regulator [Acidovorax sp. FJL06]